MKIKGSIFFLIMLTIVFYPREIRLINYCDNFKNFNISKTDIEVYSKYHKGDYCSLLANGLNGDMKSIEKILISKLDKEYLYYEHANKMLPFAKYKILFIGQLEKKIKKDYLHLSSVESLKWTKRILESSLKAVFKS